MNSMLLLLVASITAPAAFLTVPRDDHLEEIETRLLELLLEDEKRSAWDPYVALVIAYSGDNIDKAVFVDLNTRIPATNPPEHHLSMSLPEITAIIQRIRGNSADTDIYVDGTKYTILRVEETEKSLIAKNKSGLIYARFSMTMMVVAHCPGLEARCDEAVDKMMEYLKSFGQ